MLGIVYARILLAGASVGKGRSYPRRHQPHDGVGQEEGAPMYVGLIRLFLVEFTAGGDVAVIYGAPTAPWAITPCMSSSVSRLLIAGRPTKYRHHACVFGSM